MQLLLTERADRPSPAERSSAAVQFAGTLLFNLGTGAAVWAHAVTAERRYVWAPPDATGSLAFLLSGVLGMIAVAATVGGLFEPRSREWLTAAINLVGCVAFGGVSAVAAFVRVTGITSDERLANLGTFLGALCFLVAALVALPRRLSRPPGGVAGGETATGTAGGMAMSGNNAHTANATG